MAEVIVTGKKYRVLTDVAGKIWARVSFWSKGSDVECNDGATVETKIGNVKGLVDTFAVSQPGYMMDAMKVAELNSNLGGLKFYEDSTGKYVVGADSVPKKLEGEFSWKLSDGLVPKLTVNTPQLLWSNDTAWKESARLANAYYVFNGTFGGSGFSFIKNGDSYFGYDFTTPRIVTRAYVQMARVDGTMSNIRVQASHDNVGWVTLAADTSSYSSNDALMPFHFSFSNLQAYRYYRLTVTYALTGTSIAVYSFLQFYD